MKKKFLLVLTIFILFESLSYSGYAPKISRFNPLKKYKTIDSNNLTVIFPEGRESDGILIYRISQKTYRKLEKFFLWKPEKIVVALVENADFSNGYSMVSPYNLVVITDKPPSAFSEISNYSSWYELVIMHEFSHIFHLSQSRGIAKFIRAIFGNMPLSLAFPNLSSTPLLIEGVAVYSESFNTGFGRLNSSDYLAYIKRDVIRGKMPPQDRMYNFIDIFPGSKAPYLYGSYIVDEVVREAGWSSIRDSIIVNSKIPVSYFAEFYLAISKKKFPKKLYKNVLLRVKKLMENKKFGKNIILYDDYMKNLKIYGGNLYYIKNSPYDMSSVYSLKIKDGKEKKLFKFYSIESIFPSQEGIYFSALNREDRFYERSALYFYSFKGKSIKRLIKGSSFFPVLLGDGVLFFFKKVKGKFYPAVYEAKKIKLSDISFYGVGLPVWDGERKVYFPAKSDDFWDIYSYDIMDRKIERLTFDKIIERYLTFSDKKLYFVSVGEKEQWVSYYDICEKSFYKVFSSKTGFKGLAVKGKKIYTIEINEKGTGIYVYENYSCSPESKNGIIKNNYGDEYEYENDKTSVKIKNYNPYKYLIPRFWLPYPEITNDNIIPSFLIYSFTPYGEKEFYFQLGMDFSKSSSWIANISYIDEGKKFPWYFNFKKSIKDYDSIYEDIYEINTGAYYDFGDYYKRFFVGGGFFLEDHIAKGESLKFRGIYFDFSFESFKRYPLSISNEDGIFFKFIYKRSYEFLKSSYSISEVYSFLRFYKKFKPFSQVLALRFDGFYSWGKAAYFVESIGGTGDDNYYGNTLLDFSFQRGYESNKFYGQKILNSTVELRTPLGTVERGLWFLPIFLKRVYFNLFFDFSFVEFKGEVLYPESCGIEVGFSGRYGYYTDISFGMGVSKPIKHDSSMRYYIYFGERF